MYTITQISQAKKHIELVNIFLDGNFWLGLDKSDLIKFGLHKDKIIDDVLKGQLEDVNSQGKILFKVYNLLKLRPRSVKEISNYLNYKLNVEIEEVNLIINKLIDKGILSDEEFTSWYIDARLNFGIHGENKIRAELFKKGIQKKIIDYILKEKMNGENKENQNEKIRLFINKSLSSIKYKSKSELKQKLLKKLISRGFSYTDCLKLVDSMV